MHKFMGAVDKVTGKKKGASNPFSEARDSIPKCATTLTEESSNPYNVSETFNLDHSMDATSFVKHEFTVGDLSLQGYCVKFDPLNRYIA